VRFYGYIYHQALWSWADRSNSIFGVVGLRATTAVCVLSTIDKLLPIIGLDGLLKWGTGDLTTPGLLNPQLAGLLIAQSEEQISWADRNSRWAGRT
jgi:hypothetical protein